MRQQTGKVTAQLKLKTLNDNPYVSCKVSIVVPICRYDFPNIVVFFLIKVISYAINYPACQQITEANPY